MILYTIYIQPLKTIIALTLLILIAWTILGVSLKGHREIWHIINAVLVTISIAAILYTTIIKRDADGSNTMPFIRTIEHIRQQPELIREMVMNAFLFFPFGLTLPYAIEGRTNKPVFITILSALILTCVIELIQHLSNFGNCELSDIVMNTLGAAIGSVSYLVSCRLIR